MSRRKLIRLSNEEANKHTKESLQEALVRLMDEKPFDNIKITELVRTSGVSRASFYRNYRTKEDILHDLNGKLLDEVEVQLDQTGEDISEYDWYLKIFNTVKENEKYIKLLVQANVYSENMSLFQRKLRERYNVQTPMQAYEMTACEGAIIAVILEWIDNGMRETPEEMADISTRIIPGSSRT